MTWTNKLTLFLLMFSSNVTPCSTLTPTPAVVTCLCEAITLRKLCYYYAMHIITIAFACFQIQYKIVQLYNCSVLQWTCFFHLFYWHWSFLHRAMLWGKWSGCLCNSSTNNNATWKRQWGKVEKSSVSTLKIEKGNILYCCQTVQWAWVTEAFDNMLWRTFQQKNIRNYCTF